MNESTPIGRGPAPIDSQQWLDTASATLSDCLGRSQAMKGRIHRLSGDKLVGPAWTVQTVVGDSRIIHQAMASAPSGSVLVVDAGGFQDRAVFGFILATAAIQAGMRGAVIDGAVRDIDEIRHAEFPLWACGTCPAGPHKGGTGHIGEPIQCGGVVVNPSDIVCADADGVVIVPADRREEVLKHTRERSAIEAEWIERIRSGERTTSILNLD